VAQGCFHCNLPNEQVAVDVELDAEVENQQRVSAAVQALSFRTINQRHQLVINSNSQSGLIIEPD